MRQLAGGWFDISDARIYVVARIRTQIEKLS